MIHSSIQGIDSEVKDSVEVLSVQKDYHQTILLRGAQRVFYTLEHKSQLGLQKGQVMHGLSALM